MSATDLARFDSAGQARDTYFSESDTPDSGGGADTPESGAGWSEPEQIDVLEGNWYLLRQEQTLETGNRDRYFLLVGPDPDVTQAMRRGGGTVEVTEDDTFDELPSMATETEARNAHQVWLEEQDRSDNDSRDGNRQMEDSEGNQWSEWEVVQEVPPWFVLARHQLEGGDAVEFIIAGKNQDESEVFLHPDAVIESDPYVYEDEGEVQSALEAYFQAVEDGEIAEEEQPTGAAPSEDAAASAAGAPGEGEGRRSKAAQRVIGRLIRLLVKNPKIVLIVALGGVIVYDRIAPEDNPLDNAVDQVRDSLDGIGGTQ